MQHSIVNDLRGGNFEPIYEAALSVILPTFYTYALSDLPYNGYSSLSLLIKNDAF
jgi:hypothetical protein